MRQYDALIITADSVAAEQLRAALAAIGVTGEIAGSVSQAVELLNRGTELRVVVVDRQFSGGVLEFIARHIPRGSVTPLVVLTQPDSPHLYHEAMRRGAVVTLSSPFDAVAVQKVVVRALAQGKRPDVADADPPLDPSSPFLGVSRAVEALTKDVARLAKTEMSVLIQGETGTGKGVLARWMHDLSPRARRPFVEVNCAALAKDLFESEICGYEKGAFTGATSTKVGLLEAADGGTMFLDEIGDLALEVQPRLLKLIEDKRCRRLGSVREHQCDVRFVAASNQDLGLLVSERRFRADLFFRINSLTVVCPPLRDRLEDIPVLAASFLASVARHLRRPELAFSREVIDALAAHTWPGNVRELKHVVERGALMSDGDTIGLKHLMLSKEHVQLGGLPDHQESITLEAHQVLHIRTALIAEAWNVERAARRLGMARSTLYQKIKQHGLGDRLSDTDR